MTAPYGLTTLRPRRPTPGGVSPTPSTGTMPASQRPPNTFAGMQQRGLARPAPRQPNSYYQAPQPAAPGAPTPAPAAPGAPSYSTFKTPTDPNREALTNAVGQMLATPSAYSTDQLKRDYDTLLERQTLDATAGKRAIDETMARRGLHASTLTGDAYGNLESRQALERRQFSNDYLDREASDLATARANAIASALGVQQENANEGLAEFGANQAAQNQAHGQAMDVANLGLQTELGRGNLDVARRNAEANAGQLDLGYAKLASDDRNTQADLALRQMLGVGQLGLDQSRLGLDRELGMGNLSLDRERLTSANANAAADREQTAKLAAQQLGLDYAKLSQTDRQFLASLNLDTARLSSDNANAAAARALQQDLGYKADARQGEQIAATKDLAQNELWLNMLRYLGLPTSGMPGGTSTLGGSTYGSGSGTGTGTGSSGTSGGGAVTDPSFLAGPTGQQLFRSNPSLYASLALQQNLKDPNVANITMNFGGKQYSPTEYYELMRDHPELFTTQSGRAEADAWNANFFKNSHQEGGGQLMTPEFLQSLRTPADVPHPEIGGTTYDDYLRNAFSNGGGDPIIDNPVSRAQWNIAHNLPGTEIPPAVMPKMSTVFTEGLDQPLQGESDADYEARSARMRDYVQRLYDAAMAGNYGAIQQLGGVEALWPNYRRTVAR